MNFKNKNLFIKLSFITLPILIIFTILLYLSFTNSEKSESTFKTFMDLYKSKNIQEANNYILNVNLPDFTQAFSLNLSQTDNELQNQIIQDIENLMFSINYEILSSKTFLNNSTLTVKITYYDLAKHIINYFKNHNSLNQANENIYEDFLNSLKSTKYKITTQIPIKLQKSKDTWDIVMSEKLLNTLTAGIYKNFVLQKENSTKN